MAETRTERVVRCVQELIHARGLKPGDRLPTYAEIADLCGVSEATVSRGVIILQERRIVRGVPGLGLFVGSASHCSSG